MTPTTTIILPGLDGTDLLLGPFCQYAPNTLDVAVWPLPDDPTADYDDLCDHFSELIGSLDSCHLIAESFSGPLGVLLAHRHPSIVKRLTLVASFVTPPTHYAARWLPWSVIFRLPMPHFVARRFFVGPDHVLIDQLRSAVRKTSPQTLVQRVHCLMSVDVTSQLSELECGVAYLRPKGDHLVPRRSLDGVKSVCPSVSVCEIDGPHLILQSQPERAWDCILGV